MKFDNAAAHTVSEIARLRTILFRPLNIDFRQVDVRELVFLADIIDCPCIYRNTDLACCD
jgi:hypothetical protein